MDNAALYIIGSSLVFAVFLIIAGIDSNRAWREVERLNKLLLAEKGYKGAGMPVEIVPPRKKKKR